MLRIFSWNVNGVRSVLNKGALQKFISEYQPDILCLQEIKAKPEQVDYDFSGYKVFWNPAVRAGYSGTATLVSDMFFASKSSEEKNISDTNIVNIATAEGRVLALDCGEFYLINVYVPNSKPDLSRLKLRETEWDPWLLGYVKELEQEKSVVMCGDFNVAHNEIDLARPKTNHHNAGFTDEERKGVGNLLKAGLVDTFRMMHPGAQRYTWWSHWGQARANNVGWRIDYFFVSEALKSRLAEAEIYEGVMGSDHCPISITLKIDAGAQQSSAKQG